MPERLRRLPPVLIATLASMDPMAAKAQHAPHTPWFLMDVTVGKWAGLSAVRQSTPGGGATSPSSWWWWRCAGDQGNSTEENGQTVGIATAAVSNDGRRGGDGTIRGGNSSLV
jgi:hypothetical protein